MMIRTRGKQRRAHAKGHRASVEAFRRILEQKFVEKQNEIANALIDASLKANTAAVRETVKLVDGIAEPEDQLEAECQPNPIEIWQRELQEEALHKENVESAP